MKLALYGEDVKAATDPSFPAPQLLKESFGSGDTLWIIALICWPEHDGEDPGVSWGGGNGQQYADCLKLKR